MTTLVEAREAMITHMESVWLPTTLQLFLENEAHTPPSPVNGTSWALFSIRTSQSRQETLGPVGARHYERRGTAYCQIFVPQDTGTTEAADLAQAVLYGFEGARLAGTTIRFLNVTPREVGQTGRWFQHLVEIEFAYTETR